MKRFRDRGSQLAVPVAPTGSKKNEKKAKNGAIFLMNVLLLRSASLRVDSVILLDVPGLPIRINIPLDLISETQGCLDPREDCCKQHFLRRVGRVLLGHQETPATLDIDDYVWVSSEARSDGLYHLDPSTLRAPAVSDPSSWVTSGPSRGALACSRPRISFIRSISAIQLTCPID